MQGRSKSHSSRRQPLGPTPACLLLTSAGGVIFFQAAKLPPTTTPSRLQRLQSRRRPLGVVVAASSAVVKEPDAHPTQQSRRMDSQMPVSCRLPDISRCLPTRSCYNSHRHVPFVSRSKVEHSWQRPDLRPMQRARRASLDAVTTCFAPSGWRSNVAGYQQVWMR